MLKRKPQPRSPLPLPLRLGFWHRRRWMPTRFPARCPRCRRRARHVAMVCDATSRNRVHMETTWPWRTTSCGGSHPVDRRLHRAHGRRLLGPAGLLRVVPEPRRGGGPGVSTFVNVLVPAAASCAPASLRTASCGRSDVNLAIRALAKADHTLWRPWQIQRRLPGPAIQLRRAGIFPRAYARAGATQILTTRGRWAIPRSQTAA